MKTKKIIIIVASACLLLTGCNKSNSETVYENIKQLELTGTLVTLQAHYHNVIEYEKQKEKGILHVFDNDMKMFAEYNGSVQFGIDLRDVKFEANNSKIKVTIPKADVIGEPSVDQESFKKENFIVSADEFLNSNEISGEDASNALQTAQKEMKENAENDSTLKQKAQMRAKVLIKETIKQVSNLSDKELDKMIDWVYE